MSGINGVSGSGSSEIYAMLLQTGKQTAATSASGNTSEQPVGPNPGGIDDLKSQMDAAISAALAGLDKSSSADTVLKTIKEAMDSVLKANGIDPTAMKDAPPPPPPPPVENTDDSSTDDSTTGQNDLATTLYDLLKANGFDPEKIKEELLAEQGSTDTASSTSGFEMLYRILTGTGVNTQA
jgi:hypothetical protein